MIRIKVPATSANIGPGFDCMGLALDLYNLIEVKETSRSFEIFVREGEKNVPLDKRNLIYQSMLKVFDLVEYHPKGLKITLKNKIPISRGLGSSSASIINGIYAANIMTGEQIKETELLRLAANIEGHPDNCVPAALGGFVISSFYDNKLVFSKHDIDQNLRFAVFIPDFSLSTKKSRYILPKHVPSKDAVFNISRASLLAAAFITGSRDNLKFALKDRLHQPYREKLIPGMAEIFEFSMKNGAIGVYLSGSGPTIIAVLDKSDVSFIQKAKDFLSNRLNNFELKLLKPNNTGIEWEKIK